LYQIKQSTVSKQSTSAPSPSSLSRLRHAYHFLPSHTNHQTRAPHPTHDCEEKGSFNVFLGEEGGTSGFYPWGWWDIWFFHRLIPVLKSYKVRPKKKKFESVSENIAYC
jgi:hypothetical protein